MTNEDIVKMVEERMEEKEISKYRLSKLTGMSEATLGRYFNRDVQIAKPLLKICNALELKISLDPDRKET